MTEPAAPGARRVLRSRIPVVLLVTTTLLAASSLAAGGDPLGETLERFRTHYEGVRDIRTRFLQTSLVAALGSEEVSRGQLLYLRPGRLRWEVEDPEPHVLVTDGEALRMFSPEDNVLQIAPLGEGAVSQTALGFLFGESDLRRAFDVTPLGNETPGEGSAKDRGLGLKLDPKQEATFERLEVWIDPETLRVREVTIFDLLGNRTHLLLEGTEENVGLEEANFTIRVPDDTEVIDLR